MGELRVESGGVGEWLELLLIAQLGRPLRAAFCVLGARLRAFPARGGEGAARRKIGLNNVIRPRNVIDSLGLTTGNMVECAK